MRDQVGGSVIDLLLSEGRISTSSIMKNLGCNSPWIKISTERRRV
jgi:hypothetical protein